jgi:hypothetical protein
VVVVSSSVALLRDDGFIFGVIRFYLLPDPFMNMMYETLVYLLNLWLVFVTKKPLNMVLNALAMEFILRLDNEMKGIVLAVFPPHREPYRKSWNTDRTFHDDMAQYWWKVLTLVDLLVLNLTLLCLVLFLFATMIYIPLCKIGPLQEPDRGAIFFAPLTTLCAFSRDLNLKFEF